MHRCKPKNAGKLAVDWVARNFSATELGKIVAGTALLLLACGLLPRRGQS